MPRTPRAPLLAFAWLLCINHVVYYVISCWRRLTPPPSLHNSPVKILEILSLYNSPFCIWKAMFVELLAFPLSFPKIHTARFLAPFERLDSPISPSRIEYFITPHTTKLFFLPTTQTALFVLPSLRYFSGFCAKVSLKFLTPPQLCT